MPTLEKENQLVDMDPFTVFGLFNKSSMKKENRVKILSAIAEIFNIYTPVPTSFDSIPVLNNQNATFYYFVDERDESDIDDLWELFSAALVYASEPTAENRTKLSKYFDLMINKKGNGNSKITMGIYWIAPDAFLNLDQRNTWYIYDSGKMPAELVQTLPEIETKISSEKYFDIVEKLRTFLQSDKSDLNDFKELSFEAWRYSKQVNEEERAKEEVSDSILTVNKDTLVNAWLLTWNSKNYDWENEIDEYSLDTMFKTVKSGGGFYISWRCRSSNIKPGDLVFFIRLGDEPKDVFASGYIIDYSVVKNGTRCAEVLITKAIDFRTNDILSQQMLKNQFPEQQWSPQGSGISIKPEAAKWLIENGNSYQKTTSNSIDEDIVNEPVIWKISHGTPQTSGITVKMRKIFEDKKIVVVNQFTGSAGGSNITQGYVYMNEIKKGDYFFLCYAGEIVLLGQFTENEAKLNKERGTDCDDYDWYERSYRLIARSAIHEKYTGQKKVWTSNCNSTCVK